MRGRAWTEIRFAEFLDAATIEGVIVIGNCHEIAAPKAHATQSGAFLRFNTGMPLASVQRESIAKLLDCFHGDKCPCADLPGLRLKALSNLRSEYNHCSSVVSLSAV